MLKLIYKDNFNEKDIPGIILFRTEEINKDKIFFQYDSKKDKNYYILHKTLEIPKFNLISKDIIDEDENMNYASLLEKKEEIEKNNYKKCYIFLLDQSGSMSGSRIELCNKALLLFLQSLNEDCFFQLIGFGSNFEYYTKEPLEYNKENISQLMNIIKNLDAIKGGTELFSPLKDIYNNKIYEKYNMNKHIILLTDGELFDKEETLNLIGSNSNEFFFHSIGIGFCDKDLIERSALVGNGYSYYIDNLDNLNKIIISVLEKTLSEIKLECECDINNTIEDKKQKYININDYFRHGIILDNDINDICFKIKDDNEEKKISLKNIEIIRLSNGEELGKLIIDNYLIENKSLDFRTKIKLSKDYNILCSETAFYAEIKNEVSITEKMTTITNKDKIAINNSQESQEHKIRNIGYDNKNILFEPNENKIEIKEKNKGFFSSLFSIFSCKKEKNKIIHKKKFELKSGERKFEKNSSEMKLCSKEPCYIRNACYMSNINIKSCMKSESSCCEKLIVSDCKKVCQLGVNNNICKYIDSKKQMKANCSLKCSSLCASENSNRSIKKTLNFDEIILGQDIIEGNWKKDNENKILIEEEKDLYEKIKKYSENKGIKNEDGIITLFVLYYIYKKKTEKIEELKFVINKAKNYIKKAFNLDYDNIIKELDSN